METKICIGCEVEKSQTDFNKHQGRCKICQKKYNKKHYIMMQEYHKNYRSTHKNEIKEVHKEYYQKNKQLKLEQQRKYREENSEKIKEKASIFNKKYYQKNKDGIREQKKKYRKERIEKDTNFKLRLSITGSINRAMKRNNSSKNNQSYLQYVPWTISELKQHLESLFETWMNWSNRGVYNIETWDDNDPNTWTWQLDHIIPHSTFQYTSMDSQEFRDCWALSNLRPLSAKQNQLDGSNRSRHQSLG